MGIKAFSVNFVCENVLFAKSYNCNLVPYPTNAMQEWPKKNVQCVNGYCVLTIVCRAYITYSYMWNRHVHVHWNTIIYNAFTLVCL